MRRPLILLLAVFALASCCHTPAPPTPSCAPSVPACPAGSYDTCSLGQHHVPCCVDGQHAIQVCAGADGTIATDGSK